MRKHVEPAHPAWLFGVIVLVVLGAVRTDGALADGGVVQWDTP